MSHVAEYEVENQLITRLEGIGYTFIKSPDYVALKANFREQLAKFNAKKLQEKGHAAAFQKDKRPLPDLSNIKWNEGKGNDGLGF